MACLLDVNVLIALLHARHEHSADAVRWFEANTELHSIGICRIVQMGALRILTRKEVMHEDVLTPAQFWDGFDYALRDERLHMIGEPAEIETTWRRVTKALPKGAHAETDAYLAAFSIAARRELVTFDRAMRRFEKLTVTIPSQTK